MNRRYPKPQQTQRGRRTQWAMTLAVAPVEKLQNGETVRFGVRCCGLTEAEAQHDVTRRLFERSVLS